MKDRRGVTVLLGILALGSILAMISCGPSVDLTGLGNDGNTDGTVPASPANEVRIQPAIDN